MVAKYVKGFLDNVVSGATKPKGNLGDYQHAASFYVGDAFRLAPKVKFLYHVVFNLNPDCPATKQGSFKEQHVTSVGMLVKEVDLPKYKITVDTVNQYNRKKPIQTKLEYDPVQLILHDDNLGVSTQLWNLYYGYYNADTSHGGSTGSGNGQARSSNPLTGFLSGLTASGLGPNRSPATGGTTNSTTPAAFTRNAYKGGQSNGYRYGLDNNQTAPFFTSIQIFQLSRKTYQAFTLINPMISQWQHDRMMQSADSEVVQSTMTINYESVFYGTGPVSEGTPKGFATQYYDKIPSPLSLQGGGTTSLFGVGGVIGGATNILDDLTNPETFKDPSKFLGSVIKGANLFNNTKQLSNQGIRQEGANILTSTLSRAAGVNVGVGAGIAGAVFPKTIGAGQNQVVKATPYKR